MRAPLLMLLTALSLSACATRAPDFTIDGLERVDSRAFQHIYVLPGADPYSYEHFRLEPCDVEFRANWLRDQNRSRLSLNDRVQQEDMERIRRQLSATCLRTFHEVLQQDPPYTLVSDQDTVEPVLVIEPRIINLDVTAPATTSSSRTTSFTTSAGEMTLQLELSDALTGQTLARVQDRAFGHDDGRIRWQSGVSNHAEARRVLTRWANRLREGLDAALKRPPKSAE